jgi:hypothetical protein
MSTKKKQKKSQSSGSPRLEPKSESRISSSPAMRPKSSSTNPETAYASSASMVAPDPSKIPHPNFGDDFDDGEIDD